MLIIRRLAIWLLETCCEALLLGLFLAIPGGPDLRDFTKGLLVFTIGIFLVSVSTGYVLTTAIFRVVTSTRISWLYPIIATILFFIHIQIFISGANAFIPSERPRIRAAGACIVFACTLAGNFTCQKWAQADSNRPDLHRGDVPGSPGG